MSFIKKIFSRKILSSFLIISLFVSTVFLTLPTQKVSAFWPTFDLPNFAPNTVSAVTGGVTAGGTTVNAVNSTANNLKVFLLDGLAVAFARMIVQGITAQTVNWINTGFNGNPAYVTDPGKFFTDTGDKAVVGYLGANGTLLNTICTPFRPQLRLALVANYLQEGQMGRCSIQNIVQNYDAFTQDFSQGGWEGWFSMTQNMQNNPYGAYIQAQDALQLSVSAKQKVYQDQLNYGQGFLSYEKCTKYAGSTELGSSDNATTGATKRICVKNAPLVLGDPNSGQCIEYQDVVQDSNGNDIAPDATAGSCIQKETVTPGSVISNQLSKVMGSAVDELNMTQNINQIVSALMVQGIKALFGGIKDGLRGLSDSGSGNTGTSNRSLVEQMLLETSTSTPEGRASRTETLNQINSNIPSNVAPIIDPNAPATQSTEFTNLGNQIDSEINAINSSNTSSGGTISCTTDAGLAGHLDANGVCI